MEKLKDSPPGPRQQRCWPPGERTAALCSQSCMLALETLKEKERRQSRLCCLSPFLYKKKDYHLSLIISICLLAATLAHLQRILHPVDNQGVPVQPPPALRGFRVPLMNTHSPPPPPLPPSLPLTEPSTGVQLRCPTSESPSLAIPPTAAWPLPQSRQSPPITNHRSPNHCFPRRIRCYLKYSNCLLPPSSTRM